MATVVVAVSASAGKAKRKSNSTSERETPAKKTTLRGRAASKAFDAWMEAEAKAFRPGYVNVVTYTPVDTDSSHNLSLEDLKSKSRFMVVPQSFLDARRRASLMVGEIMCSVKKSSRDIIMSLLDGTYTEPTIEDSREWCLSVTNTASSTAMRALIAHEIKHIQALFRKSKLPEVFDRLFGEL